VTGVTGVTANRYNNQMGPDCTSLEFAHPHPHTTYFMLRTSFLYYYGHQFSVSTTCSRCMTYEVSYCIVLQQYSIELLIPTKLTLESKVLILWYCPSINSGNKQFSCIAVVLSKSGISAAWTGNYSKKFLDQWHMQ